jgi:hypothetical protein
MAERNTPLKTLESWKQIAAYLNRSERTVRRWEASEGLPIHRREHEKQDTVFAYRHEIEAWSRLHTKCPGEISIDEGESVPPIQPAANAYLSNTTRSPVLCTVISRALAQATEISCAMLFIPLQRFPATAKGSNIVAPWNTCSSGSPRMVQRRISIHASHESRSSRASPSFIWKFKDGQANWLVPMPELPTYSRC